MSFEFHRLRLRFRARECVLCPPGATGNLVRGFFGAMLRRVACAPECPGADSCVQRDTCLYARWFEPRAARGVGPSGLADWPRPFVFRVAHLDGRRFEPGQLFHVDMHLFDVAHPHFGALTESFARLASEGWGPGRGRADLLSAELLNLDGAPLRQLSIGESRDLQPPPSPSSLCLERGPRDVSQVCVRFVTPTEIKGAALAQQAAGFAVLFARIRDRISTLRALYGPGPLSIDFRAMGERAAGVTTVRSDLRWRRAGRRSSRTGQVHPLGGWTGEAEYRGPLGEFLPYLEAAQWTGVGRQTVWGKGEIEIRVTATSGLRAPP